MRLLFFGDLHSHNHEQFSIRLPNGRNSRLQDCLDIVQQAIDIVKEKKIDVVFFLGDLYHSRTRVDVDVYNSTFRAFKYLASTTKQLFLLVGNHDQHTRVGDVHSLEAYREIATVIDQPWLTRIGAGTDSIVVAFHPYTTNVPNMLEFMKRIPKGTDLFLFHQGIKEAAVGPYDMHVKAEISLKDLPSNNVRLSCGAHYHKGQVLLDGKVWYIGSPLQQSFGEREESKGFIWIDSKNWKPKLVISNAPKFFLFNNTVTFLDFAQKNKGTLHNNFIRTYCTPTERDRLEREYPQVQFEEIYEEQQVLVRIDPALATSDKHLLQTYVGQKKPSLDNHRLLALGLELLTGEIDD